MSILKEREAIGYIIVAILLNIAVFHVWFSFSVFQHADWNYSYAATLRQLLFPTTWGIASDGFGTFDLTFWRLPIYFLYGIFGLLGFNSTIPDFFLVFFPIIFLTPLFGFLLVRRVTHSNTAGFIGALLISFNTYSLAILTQGHELINVAMAFCLGSLYFFDRGLEDSSIVNFILSALFLTISDFYDLRISYITLLILFLFFIYRATNAYSLSDIYNLFWRICLPFTLFLLLNFYWFLPQFLAGSLFNNPVLDRNLFGNNFWNLSASLSLFHPFWTGTYIKWFSLQSTPAYFYIIPLLCFMPFTFRRKSDYYVRNKKLALFGVIALIGVFLSKQVDVPLPSVYPWLYGHLPGFNAFREATKFYFLIIIGYAMLLGFFTSFLLDGAMKGKAIVWAKWGVLVAIGCLFLLNARPIVTGAIDTMFVPRVVPSDYLALKSVSLKQPTPSRTLWIPRNSRWGINLDAHPLLSATGLLQSNWLPVLDLTSSDSPDSPTEIIGIFQHTFSRALVNVSGVRYVIVPIQDTINNDDLFQYYGGDNDPNIRQWYIDQLDKVPFLKKFDIGTKDLVVYENPTYKPPIFAFDALYGFDSMANLDQKFGFIDGTLKGDFYFTPRTTSGTNAPLTDLSDLLEGISPDDISSQGLSKSFGTTAGKSNVLYGRPRQGTLQVDGVAIASARTPLAVTTATSSLVYTNATYTFANLLPNGSFEAGLWQPKVGDCNHFDDNGLVAMSLDTQNKSDGAQSLQLEATRHIACTSRTIPVNPGGTYLVSFDYQSPNASRASYYVGFNDPNKTSTHEDLPLADTGWHTFSQTFTVPAGATKMSLYLYAKSTDGKTNIINRYDNAKIIQVPDLAGAFYLVSKPTQELQQPASTTFELINPTKKLVHITGATTPFFLAMSESYHDKWQLELDDAKVQGFFDSWWPFVHPHAVAGAYHYQLDGFLNAWYVDPAALCAGGSTACTKNPDGSYDIEMQIEFTPQRWFYLGLLISGTTLLGCLGYLGYEGVQGIRRRRRKRYEE